MIAELSRNWWVFLIRGIAAILFGMAAFIRPGLNQAVQEKSTLFFAR